MGRDRGQQPSPDLFSTTAVRDNSSPLPREPAPEATTEPAPQRHVLPKNLSKAVKHLSDEELDLLRAATLEEMKRRGKLPPSVGADLRQSPGHSSNSVIKRLPPSGKSSQRREADVPAATLTRGQVNVIRSAFKAGTTPARIGRQFGISRFECQEGAGQRGTKGVKAVTLSFAVLPRNLLSPQ
jgi:hypothetical protein